MSSSSAELKQRKKPAENIAETLKEKSETPKVVKDEKPAKVILVNDGEISLNFGISFRLP